MGSEAAVDDEMWDVLKCFLARRNWCWFRMFLCAAFSFLMGGFCSCCGVSVVQMLSDILFGSLLPEKLTCTPQEF